jgi:hypothetical protein
VDVLARTTPDGPCYLFRANLEKSELLCRHR